MKSGLEIAQEAVLRPITDVAAGAGILQEELVPYGRYLQNQPDRQVVEDRARIERGWIAGSREDEIAARDRLSAGCPSGTRGGLA